MESSKPESTEHADDCTCASCDPGRLGFKPPRSQSTETYEERVARYAAEKIAEDETVTDEMIQAARLATRPEDDCPPDELITRIYRVMRREKRETMERLAKTNWVMKVFKPLPPEEADALREFLP